MRRQAWACLAVVMGIAVAAGCGDGDAADPVAFCERLDRLARNDPFDAFEDTVGPEEIRAGFAALGDRARDLERLAPADVAPTARTYREAIAAMDSLLAGAGYDGAALDRGSYRVHQERYVEASRRLVRHLEAQC